MKFWSALIALSLVSGAAQADHLIECKMGSKLRKIEVIHETGKPCDVLYTKEGETAATALWTYEKQTDQCPVKAKFLADKLAGFGWNCAEVKPAAAAAAPAATPAPAAAAKK